MVEFTHFASTGQLNFNGSFTGLGMGDFFLGNLNRLFQGLPNTNATRQNSVNLYLTDAWKVTPRLTFNYISKGRATTLRVAYQPVDTYQRHQDPRCGGTWQQSHLERFRWVGLIGLLLGLFGLLGNRSQP